MASRGMQTVETSDSKKPGGHAQYLGPSRTLIVGNTLLQGVVQSVREDRSGAQPVWIVTVSSAMQTHSQHQVQFHFLLQ
jgi:hypothetical protein